VAEPETNLHSEEGVVTEAPDIGTLAVLNKSEIDQQIATAKKYPRSIVSFRKEALQLATLDETTAAECIYALPRDGKTIEGPSARFAEIINYSWGNTRAGARTISEEGDFVKSQGVFYDLEKNTAISYEVSRRIVDRNNKRFKADMIGTTSNAACSIALRNAILKGIPKALWKPIYDAARKVVAGDFSTLANRREEALKAFAIYGVKPEAIYATLGVNGKEDITIDHMVILKGIYTAIQEGDTTPEQAFAAPVQAPKDEHPEEKALREEAFTILRSRNFNEAQCHAQIGKNAGKMAAFMQSLKMPHTKEDGGGSRSTSIPVGNTPEGQDPVTQATEPRQSVAQPSGNQAPPSDPAPVQHPAKPQPAPVSAAKNGGRNARFTF
jgi:hypothetical protein